MRDASCKWGIVETQLLRTVTTMRPNIPWKSCYILNRKPPNAVLETLITSTTLFLKDLVDGPKMVFYHLLRIQYFHFHFAKKLMKEIL